MSPALQRVRDEAPDSCVTFQHVWTAAVLLEDEHAGVSQPPNAFRFVAGAPEMHLTSTSSLLFRDKLATLVTEAV